MKKEIFDRLIALEQEKNNITICIAREYVKEIFDIIEDIAKTRILDDSIYVALNKLIGLKSILIEEDYRNENKQLKE